MRAHAQISASITEGCAPLTNIQFNHTFPNATNINWTFGNGASSNLPNPTNTYTLPGIYTVTFTANSNGSPVTQTLSIEVYAPPTPSFDALGVLGGCTGLSVSFDDTSVGGGGVPITNWQWAFGDGGVNSINTGNPTYVYNVPGLFDVSLIVTDANGCVASVSQEEIIAISGLPTVAVITNPNPATACEPPLNVNFTANTSSNSPLGETLTYAWDFDNGQTSTVVNPPQQTYTSSGVYIVTLQVTDDNNCSRTVNSVVSITQPIASIAAIGGENGIVCQEVFFVNNSTNGTFSIDYGDGTSDDTLYHFYNAEGFYDVTLTLQSGNCTDDTTITLFVQVPAINITAPSDTVCDFPYSVSPTVTTTYPIANYAWAFPGGVTSSDPTPTEEVLYYEDEYTINILYDLPISLLATTPDGCQTQDIDYIYVHKPNALFYPDVVNGCAPLAVNFTDWSISEVPEIVSWQWHFGDGTPPLSNAGENVAHTYQEPGVYESFLVIETSTGCIDTSYSHFVHVGSLPNPSFTVSPTEVCPGDPIQLIDTTSPADSIDTWTFTGDNQALFSCSDTSAAEVSFGQVTGIQTITMTVGNDGCYASTSQQITVRGPIGDITYSCNCDTPMDYPFEVVASDADSWTIDFGDGQVAENISTTNVNHTYAESGDYEVILTSFNNSSGCAPDTDTILVRVRNLQAIINLPDTLCLSEAVPLDALLSIDDAVEDEVCHHPFVWYFGDNTQPYQTSQAITHDYNNPGVYLLELWVEDINGCVDSASHELNLFEVNADFSYVADGVCLPMEVAFTNTSSATLPIATYQWSLDDVVSNEVSPNYTFPFEGIGPSGSTDGPIVTLTVIDEAGCSDEISVELPINIPNANFSNTTPSTICEGGSVTFDPTLPQGNNMFSWESSIGQIASTYNPSFVFPEPGQYSVTLTVTNSVGCDNTQTFFNVNAQAFPNAGFVSSLVEGEPLCYPAQITFTDTTTLGLGGSRIWNLGNGAPAIGTPSIGANYNLPGDYTITLISSTSAGCADTASLAIQVDGPLGDFTLSPSTICRGDDITLVLTDTTDVFTWSWDFGDGTNAGPLGTVNHQYDFAFNPPTNQTIVSLVLWNNDSICNIAISEEINFVNIVADFLRNDELAPEDSIHCFGIPDNFENNSSSNVDQWSWNFGNGQTFNGLNPPAINFQPGTYDVTLAVTTLPEGCVDTVQKTMLIHPLPNPVAVGGAICLGENIQLNASGGEEYVWSPTETLDNPSIANPIAFPSLTTTYSVSVTDTNSCVNTADATVIVFQPPIAQNTIDTLIIGEFDEVTAGPLEGYTYEWTPDIWITCNDCNDVLIQPLADTTYFVTIRDSLGCFEVISRYEYIVLPLASLDVPDAFTPNGDGVNDFIYVRGWGIEDLISFEIYNRWGELVFETSDLNEGWNGQYKNEIQMADTYAYVVKAKPYISNIPLVKEGFINIIR